MAMYLFIYTLIGFSLAYFTVPLEPTLFKRYFYTKVTIFIITWPIAAIIYLFLLGA